MTDLEVNVCSKKVTPWKVTVPDAELSVFTDAQKKAIEDQISVLGDMVSLLEFKDYVTRFINEFQPAYEQELMRITGQPTFDKAESKAAVEQMEEADNLAAEKALKIMFPDKDVAGAIAEIFSKVSAGSLSPETLKLFASNPRKKDDEAGVAYALKELFGKVADVQKKLIGRLDKTTIDLINTCDPSSSSGNLLALDVVELRTVKVALEQFLKLRIEKKEPKGKFALIDEAKGILKRKSSERVAEDTKEPDTWGDSFDRYLASHPGVPRPFGSLTLGGNYAGSLSDAKLKIGEVASTQIPVTAGMGGTIGLNWHTDIKDLHLEATPYDSYAYRGLLGAEATSPNVNGYGHENRLGLFLSMIDLNRNTYIPRLGLRTEYYNYSTNVPNLPNPNETSFRLSASANEYLYDAGSWGRYSLDIANDLGMGSRNDLGWTRNVLTLAPRFNLGRGYAGLGYRNVYESQELRLSPFTPEGQRQFNTGHGVSASAGYDFGKYGTIDSIVFLDSMNKFYNPAGFNLRYSRSQSFGTPFASLAFNRQNLNDGTNSSIIGRLGVDGIRLSGSRDGGSAVMLDVSAYGGIQDIARSNEDSLGSVPVAGVLATLRFGSAPQSPAVRRNIGDVAYYDAQSELSVSRARVLSKDDISVFSDPLVRTLVSDYPLDSHVIAAYLVAFKEGKLGSDYSMPKNSDLSGVVSRARTIDASEFGYVPVAADKVKLGDVAPVAFFVGEQSSNGIADDVLIEKNDKDIYRNTSGKNRVLDIAAKRKGMIDETLPVAASNAGTEIAKDLLDAIEAIFVKDGMAVAPDGVTVEGLNRELKAQVVGSNVLAYARAILADVAGVKADGLSTLAELNRKMVDVIEAKAYGVVKQDSDPKQELPSAEEMKAILGGVKLEDKPAADKPVADKPVAELTPIERAKAAAATKGISFMTKDEAIAAKTVRKNYKNDKFEPVFGYKFAELDSSLENYAVVKIEPAPAALEVIEWPSVKVELGKQGMLLKWDDGKFVVGDLLFVSTEKGNGITISKVEVNGNNLSQITYDISKEARTEMTYILIESNGKIFKIQIDVQPADAKPAGPAKGDKAEGDAAEGLGDVKVEPDKGTGVKHKGPQIVPNPQ